MSEHVVTPEEMEREAEVVADALAGLIEAGVNPDLSVAKKVQTIAVGGFDLFGDVQAGVDGEANRARFGMNVAGKIVDKLADRLLPLTRGGETVVDTDYSVEG